MRSVTHTSGRTAMVLASVMVVGTAAAADVDHQDPAVTMISPARHFSLQQPIVPEFLSPLVTAADTPVIVEGMGTAIGADALDGYRGGDIEVDNEVNIGGEVTGNTANRIVSGSNVIQEGAFTNSSGISTVIQNSGSNVLIQNGMVVTVQFTDPGL